ncbi:tetratricopeptide repeat-containing sensor histidine kinase [Aquimarina macrocephali]|uniref:tetratricopeptide repeat-containing sensor histidine kinase n=1 Tax=Aquimarina macrocephali TaxID=666563 RepID=UPI000465335F|nr:tetratricopeptide repeat-containing sensor histidine kinase [Aquimarina macrocephali]
MTIFSKPTLVFIFLIVCSIAKAQTKEGGNLKIPKKDHELLEQAKNYLEEENEEQKEAFRISHDVLKRTKSEKNKVIANSILSKYHYYKYATDSSLFYAKKAVGLIGNKQDSLSLKYLSSLYTTLSNASRDKNLIEASKKWALKGIETAQKSGNLEDLDKHTSNLAITYRLVGNIPKALELLESTLSYRENPNRYASIAICYLELKNYTKALFYHKKALDYYITTDNKRSEAITLLNIGAVYMDMNEDDMALVYFNKSLPIAEEYNYPLIILNNMLNISEVFQSKKEFKKAKKGYNEVLSLARESGYLEQQLYIYQRLKVIALEEKKYKKALDYTEKKNQIQDSIHNLQKDEEVAKLEIQYETLKKEKEITILKKNQEFKVLEIKRQQFQKQTLTYAFIVILIPLAGLLFLYYQRLKNQRLLHKKEKEIGEQKIEALIRGQELKLIKNSISIQDKERKRIAQQLHDRIGGNLAAIKLQFNSVKKKSENLDVIYQQLDETYKQVRELSHDLIPKKFRHNNFIQLLKEYMQNIGNASKLSIHISTYSEHKINEIDHSFHNQLFSIFQELITNTIKHANARKVEIQIDFIDDLTHIIYEDNGNGFDISVTSLGIGLSNIESRIQKLSGVMHIDSRLKRGTIITIEIPRLLQQAF